MDVDDEKDPEVFNQVSEPNQASIVQVGRIYGDAIFSTAPSENAQANPLTVTVEEVSSRYGPASVRWNVRLLVEARGTQAVVLRALRPVIAGRISPAWRMMPPRLFGIWFSKDKPVVRARRGRWLRRAAQFPFSVTSLDPELFDLLVDVPYRLAVQLELDWTCAGSEGTFVVSRDNEPYKIRGA